MSLVAKLDRIPTKELLGILQAYKNDSDIEYICKMKLHQMITTKNYN